MLIRFTVENFLSFKERIEFSMIPSQVRQPDDIKVLKTAVVYGANAAGKSNLIRAMDFAKKLITEGTEPNKFIPLSSFKLDETSLDKPSRFEFEFKQSGKNYAYGFSLNHQWILEEWLYEINQIDEKPLFERQTQKDEEVIVTPGATLQLSDDELGVFKYTGNIGTRPNQLFLTEISKLHHKKLNLSALIESYQWFDKVLTIMLKDTKSAGLALQGEHLIQDNFSNLLNIFDTGITGIKTIEVDFNNQLKDLSQAVKDNIALNLESGESILVRANNRQYVIFREGCQIKAVKLMTQHPTQGGLEALFEINEESEGTQRLIDLIPALRSLLNSEKVLVIDEFERSLHPRLTKALLALFLTHCPDINSQLIVTTHEAGLLDLELLRKDEIWFVEKNQAGESSVYSLEEFKPNYDKDIQTGYLLGRFGAVPLIRSRLFKSPKVES
ncbi:MAG: ATP/GTP-binding protein [Pseudomonadota bacterium]